MPGIVSTADALMNRSMPSTNPFGPAGITGMTQQGWLQMLQGMGAQAPILQQYAQQMGGLGDLQRNMFMGGLGSGAFSSNPMMQQAAMQQMQAQNQPGFGMGTQAMRGALDPRGFQEGNQLYRNAMNQPGFGQSAQQTQAALDPTNFNQARGGVGSTLGQFGGGYDQGMANTINQTGASFDPYNNPALGASVSEANKRLARDFNQGTMQQLNQGLAKSGPGAYGGTRAGVAQGIREQGLADAMGKQTTDMLSRGYEAGLGRQVQDRSTTVNATLDALRSGGALGMQGAQLLGNLAGQQGQLGMQGAQQYGNLANMQGQLGMQGAQGVSDNANRYGNLGIQAGQGMGNIANQQGNLGMQGANLMGQMGQYGLGQQNNMFQWGMGSMMPQSYQNAMQAGLMPGQLQERMGGAMQNIGNQQQQQNQQMLNWYNNQANTAAGWPDQQYDNWLRRVGPWYQGMQGNRSEGIGGGGNSQGGNTGSNPWAAAIGGAATGAGIGGQIGGWWNNQQSPRVPGDANYPANDSRRWGWG